VRDRQAGVSPVTALHRHFRAGLDRYEPRHRPQRSSRGGDVSSAGVHHAEPGGNGSRRYMLEDEEALAGALGPGIEARLAGRPGARGHQLGTRPDQLAEKIARNGRTPPATSTPRHGRRRRPGLRFNCGNAPLLPLWGSFLVRAQVRGGDLGRPSRHEGSRKLTRPGVKVDLVEGDQGGDVDDKSLWAGPEDAAGRNTLPGTAARPVLEVMTAAMMVFRACG